MVTVVFCDPDLAGATALGEQLDPEALRAALAAQRCERSDRSSLFFDDIQWAEEPFRDLVEHVALLSAGAPILLLCMARPELVDRRPSWPAALRLEALAERDVERLIAERVPDELREKIIRMAGGNPLFAEDAAAELEKALALYEQKGNLVVATRARARLAELRS